MQNLQINMAGSCLMKSLANFFSLFLILVVEINPQQLPLSDSSLLQFKSGNLPGKSFHTNSNYNFTSITPNQITQWISDIGLNHNPKGAGSGGFIWPAGTQKSAIYEDGIIWAGTVNGGLRCGGSTYRSGLQPGNIVANGIAANPLDSNFNVWKIRTDWKSLPPGTERDMYSFNESHWPGHLGAPFEDVNHDGKFSKGIDAPKYIGTELCWFVANDLDSSKTKYLYGTQPVGVEMQVTEFGFNTTTLSDVIFKKVKLINKSSNVVNDMYISIWSDPDLGDAGDDFVGCDTVLNLGYVYNGDDMDGVFSEGPYGLHPPAAGYQMVQTPIVSGTFSDSAFSEGIFRKGKKNVAMNSFFPCIGANNIWADYYLGDMRGAQQIYYNMQGMSVSGAAVINPVTNQPAKFALSGDPVGGTGWYEGAGWPNGFAPGDRRFLMSFGPFNFAPTDTQEIIYATMIAQGSSNIESITALKNLCKVVKSETQNIFSEMVEKPFIPTDFKLDQNYPNPFNPSTTISYSLPFESVVKIIVYNALGQTVREVINDQQQTAGKKFIPFTGSGLSSGIYFYSITAKSIDGTREFHDVKKMVVLK